MYLPEEDEDAQRITGLIKDAGCTAVAIPGDLKDPEFARNAVATAVNDLAKGLAAQLAPWGIRVDAVAPGPIWTPLQPAGGQPPDAFPSVI